MVCEIGWCLLIATLIGGSMKYENDRQPGPEVDKAYVEWAQQKKYSWRIKDKGENVSPEVRNRVLAEIIESGACKDMKHLEEVAKAAQLNESVTLASDKKIEQIRKWFFFTEDKVVVTPKTPLKRAQDKKNAAVAMILQKLSEQQAQQVK